MRLVKCFLIIAAFCYAANGLEKARYDNYRVYKVQVENDKQVELMVEIENFPDGVRGVKR